MRGPCWAHVRSSSNSDSADRSFPRARAQSVRTCSVRRYYVFSVELTTSRVRVARYNHLISVYYISRITPAFRRVLGLRESPVAGTKCFAECCVIRRLSMQHLMGRCAEPWGAFSNSDHQVPNAARHVAIVQLFKARGKSRMRNLLS